jgi:hypothetical protein
LNFSAAPAAPAPRKGNKVGRYPACSDIETAALAPSPDVVATLGYDVSSAAIRTLLRENWHCKTGWQSHGVRGIQFPSLIELRKIFDAKHGPQEWDEDITTWVAPSWNSQDSPFACAILANGNDAERPLALDVLFPHVERRRLAHGPSCSFNFALRGPRLSRRLAVSAVTLI